MPTELESKTRVESHDPAREKLRGRSAVYVGRVLETNQILDRDDGELLRTGCGLRVRSIRVLDGQPPARSTVTYKGAKTPGKFKSREEWETPIEDGAALTAILAALGYKPRIVFEKRRETWRLGPCTVELDELPVLGRFIEVEGPDEAAILGVLTDLGLAGEPSINESYVGLLMAGEPPPSGETREFRFS